MEKYISGVVCSSREGSLKKQRKQHTEENIACCNQYHPASPNLKKILMRKWYLIQNYTAKKKNHQNISWSELIQEDRGLKSLANGRSIMQARQYFKF